MKHGFLRLISLSLILMIVLTITACSKSAKDSTQKADTTLSQENVETDTSDKLASQDSDSKENQDVVSGNQNEGKNNEEEKNDVKVVPVSELSLVEGGIKKVYEEYGMKAGTCISDHIITQSKFSEHIIENYNSVTMENDMKPDYTLNKDKSIATNDIVVEFSQKTLNMLEWAKNNNLAVRGHTLVWYSQTPQWIFYEGFDTTKSLVDRDTMLKRMESYIKQVFEQLESFGYLDLFYAYDVVNEGIMEDGSYRDCNWKQIIGDDYIWYAFYYADKYAPDTVKLYYNDYNEQFKTQHIVKLANTLVDETGRYLIDGIGCQGHLYTKDSIDSYMKTLKAFSELGLDVQITELDISLGEWTNILAPTEENLIAQGKYYYDLISRIAADNKAGITKVSGITFWGISDANSWRSDRNPLLFDKMFKPKYAYFGAVLDRDHSGY